MGRNPSGAQHRVLLPNGRPLVALAESLRALLSEQAYGLCAYPRVRVSCPPPPSQTGNAFRRSVTALAQGAAIAAEAARAGDIPRALAGLLEVSIAVARILSSLDRFFDKGASEMRARQREALHDVAKRLSRALLTASDRERADELPDTEEAVSFLEISVKRLEKHFSAYGVSREGGSLTLRKLATLLAASLHLTGLLAPELSPLTRSLEQRL